MIASKHHIQALFRSSIFVSLLYITSEFTFLSSAKADVSYPAEVDVSDLKFPIPFKNCSEMQKYFNDRAYQGKEEVRYQEFEKYPMRASSFEYHSGPSEQTYCNNGYIGYQLKAGQRPQR